MFCSFLLTTEEKEPKKIATPNPYIGALVDSEGKPSTSKFWYRSPAFAQNKGWLRPPIFRVRDLLFIGYRDKGGMGAYPH